MNAITITNLSKKYGEFTAVDDLNLTIEQGELFSLLGVNGAGKTTTIKMLSCLIQPTGGDAVLLGDSVKKHPQAVKAKINISPQETAVAANLSVIENLELIAGIYGQDSQTVKKSADKMVTQFGLDDVRNKKNKAVIGRHAEAAFHCNGFDFKSENTVS